MSKTMMMAAFLISWLILGLMCLVLFGTPEPVELAARFKTH